MQVSASHSNVSIPELESVVRGQVIGPDHQEYDRARTVVAGDIDRRPAAIVRVADAKDVAAVVSFARERGLLLAVRSGGHSGAGYGVVDDGVVIDLRAMKAFEIDPDARTAWAETGLTAGEYTIAAAAHGLATGFGDTASVGLGGLTLGGGVGYLVRKYGLTIDALLAAEIVTADGQIRIVDDEHDPDLFWAIRGGGGNFGVATRFKFRLYDVSSFVGGMLLLPATPETVHGFIQAAAGAPEELSAIANVMPAMPMPFIPAEHHGTLAIMALMAWAGDVEAGQKAMEPFRALATPIVDMVQPMPYPQIYGPPPEEGAEEYHPTAIARTLFIDDVDRDTARLIVDKLNASDASVRVAQLRVLGGASARVPADATAYAHRTAPIMVNIAAFYEGEDDRPRRQAWVEEFTAALDRDGHGAYVNFLVDEGPERVQAAYPGGTWDRLAAIKARYDPTNLFRVNQNVPPATAS